jgi:hypothetical protein
MYELREDGIAAIRAPNCRRKLHDLAPDQLVAVMERLVRLRPRYPKIDGELLAFLADLQAGEAPDEQL